MRFEPITGIYSHYLIPALRNPNPWGIFKAPLLKNHEYGHFEVKEPARVMWFETLSILLSFLERYFILPGPDYGKNYCGALKGT